MGGNLLNTGGKCCGKYGKRNGNSRGRVIATLRENENERGSKRGEGQCNESDGRYE